MTAPPVPEVAAPQRARFGITYRESRSDCDPQWRGYAVEGWAMVVPGAGLLTTDDESDDEGQWTLRPWHTVSWVEYDIAELS